MISARQQIIFLAVLGLLSFSTGEITTWLKTLYFNDHHCKDLGRATYESFGTCLKSTATAEDGGDVYYTDALQPTASPMLGAVLTYYYTSSDCTVQRSKMPPTTDSVNLYPDCTNVMGVYIMTEIVDQPEPPSLPFEGGYLFTTYTTSSCEGESGIYYSVAKAENSCVTTSNRTSVSFQCSSDEEGQAGGIGQKMIQTRYSCADCHCLSSAVSKTVVMSECSSKTINSKEIYYSAVCDAIFPAPSPPPLPVPGISSWLMTTDYADDSSCSDSSASDSLLESYGLCMPTNAGASVQDVEPEKQSLFKLNVLETWKMSETSVPITTYYYTDDSCVTPADSVARDTSEQELGASCFYNPNSATYMTVNVFDQPEEPSTPYTGGFVYTSYATDQCYSSDKIFSMITVLDTCVRSGNSTAESSYIMSCSSDGKSVTTKSYMSVADCSGVYHTSTRPLVQCMEDPQQTGSFYTLECLSEFEAPTPAPGSEGEMPIEIQGWVTTREYDGASCSGDPAYESSSSVGLCIAEDSGETDEQTGAPIINYKTEQVTDTSSDEFIITTTYYFANSDCSGEYVLDPVETRYNLDRCELGEVPAIQDNAEDGGNPTSRATTTISSSSSSSKSQTQTQSQRRLALTRRPTRRPTLVPTLARPSSGHTPVRVTRAPSMKPTTPTSSITIYQPGFEVPQAVFSGGYYYVTYGSQDCTTENALFVYVAPENKCIRYNNGTAYVSSSYTCDTDGSGGVDIDDFDTEDCTGPFRRTTADASTCAPEEDGTFSSLQCMSEFPAPTPAPALAAEITAWISVDYYGQDSSCKGEPVSSYATSYGLCLSANSQDEDGNDLYYIDSVEASNSDNDNSEVAITTYYYTDAECTVDSGDPVDDTVMLYNCEKDETGNYAISYFADGAESPQVPFSGGYLNVIFDSEDCVTERKMEYVASSDGECAAELNPETNKITSYTAVCESDGSGVQMKSFSKPGCKGTSKTEFLEATPCAYLDENNPALGAYSLQCGEFTAPTPAPAPAQREISGWLATQTFQGRGCDDNHKTTWETLSYGLCTSLYNATDGTTINFVRDLVFDSSKQGEVTISSRIFEDEDCAFPLEVSSDEQAQLMQKVNLDSCSDDEDGTASNKVFFQPGPVPPTSPYDGGYMVKEYNYDTCSYDATTSISIIPTDNLCVPGEDAEAGVKSYSVECDADKGAQITRYASSDCSGSSVDSFLQTAEECVDDTTDTNRVFNSYICTTEFPPAPTGPPVPAPSSLALAGWITEQKYSSDSCDEVLKSESYSVGLCKKSYDVHADQIHYELRSATLSDEGKTLTVQTYFFEDPLCTIFRNEADELTLEELGTCQDGGDGAFYKQFFHIEPELPANPFQGGVVQVEFADDRCSASATTHVGYDPTSGQCVNSTSASSDDDYSYYITGSETYSCYFGGLFDTGVEIKHYNESDCRGDYSVERVRSTPCSSKVAEDGVAVHYSLQCSIMGAPTPAPMYAPTSDISLIDFVATQTISGCSIEQYRAAPPLYDKALKTAIASACGTPSVIPADVQYVNVNPGVGSRRVLVQDLGAARAVSASDPVSPRPQRPHRQLSATARQAVEAAKRAGRASINVQHQQRPRGRHARRLLSSSASSATAAQAVKAVMTPRRSAAPLDQHASSSSSKDKAMRRLSALLGRSSSEPRWSQPDAAAPLAQQPQQLKQLQQQQPVQRRGLGAPLTAESKGKGKGKAEGKAKGDKRIAQYTPCSEKCPEGRTPAPKCLSSQVRPLPFPSRPLTDFPPHMFLSSFPLSKPSLLHPDLWRRLLLRPGSQAAFVFGPGFEARASPPSHLRLSPFVLLCLCLCLCLS